MVDQHEKELLSSDIPCIPGHHSVMVAQNGQYPVRHSGCLGQIATKRSLLVGKRNSPLPSAVWTRGTVCIARVCPDVPTAFALSEWDECPSEYLAAVDTGGLESLVCRLGFALVLRVDMAVHALVGNLLTFGNH